MIAGHPTCPVSRSTSPATASSARGRGHWLLARRPIRPGRDLLVTKYVHQIGNSLRLGWCCSQGWEFGSGRSWRVGAGDAKQLCAEGFADPLFVPVGGPAAAADEQVPRVGVVDGPQQVCGGGDVDTGG